MIEYRRIVESDIEQAAQFAIAGLRPELYPSLRISPEKVRAALVHFSQSVSDFHVAAVDGGEIVGGLALAVFPSIFFERSEALIVLLRATRPGVGRKMLGAMRAWIDGMIHIRKVQYMEELDSDPRIGKLMARYGFTQSHAARVYLKGS